MVFLQKYRTPVGFSDLIMTSDGAVLTGLWFDGPQDESKHRQNGNVRDLPVFCETRRWLDIYFSGHQPDFIPPYRIDGLTPFRQDVVDAMLAIPFGETTTYGDIATTIARERSLARMSAQAVGQAVGWNPLCIIVPCHRVVGATGNLVGYGGGIRNKIALLAHEGRDRLRFLSLREVPCLKATASAWFHSKWRVPREAYATCMDAYLRRETELGWYLCLDGERIVGGLGVVENDFHDRKDLSPNICAVYTEEAYRGRGIAGRLLDTAVEDLRAHGISPVYLLSDHTGFYERYGWTFLCLAQGDADPAPSRMYVHV